MRESSKNSPGHRPSPSVTQSPAISARSVRVSLNLWSSSIWPNIFLQALKRVCFCLSLTFSEMHSKPGGVGPSRMFIPIPQLPLPVGKALTGENSSSSYKSQVTPYNTYFCNFISTRKKINRSPQPLRKPFVPHWSRSLATEQLHVWAETCVSAVFWHGYKIQTQILPHRRRH